MRLVPLVVSADTDQPRGVRVRADQGVQDDRPVDPEHGDLDDPRVGTEPGGLGVYPGSCAASQWRTRRVRFATVCHSWRSFSRSGICSRSWSRVRTWWRLACRSAARRFSAAAVCRSCSCRQGEHRRGLPVAVRVAGTPHLVLPRCGGASVAPRRRAGHAAAVLLDGSRALLAAPAGSAGAAQPLPGPVGPRPHPAAAVARPGPETGDGGLRA